MNELFNTIKNNYDILDNLTKRLQDNYNNDTEFEQMEEDRIALSSLLECFDSIKEEEINTSEKYILLKDSNDKDWQDLLIFDKKLTDEEYKKIEFLVDYTRNYNGFCIDDIVEEIRNYKNCDWLELTDGRIKIIEY